jgi:hypothetical protein
MLANEAVRATTKWAAAYARVARKKRKVTTGA